MRDFINIVVEYLFENAEPSPEDQIKSYNAGLRQKSGGVSLSRNPLFDTNIPYQKGNYYRVIGDAGLEDFHQCGVLRANPDGKGGFAHAYYEVGKANDIYAKGAKGNVVAEVEPEADRFEKGTEGGYPRTKPGEEISKRDKLRIWVRNPATNRHEIKFDNIHDAVSNAPHLHEESIDLT